MVGTIPKSVEVKSPGKYLVMFETRDAFHKFLMCNERRVIGTDKKVAIKQCEQVLSCENIFRLVEQKLEIEGQQALYMTNRGIRDKGV